MSNKAMYILVNEDIKISKGKLAGQVGHAVCTYLYRNYIRNYDDKVVNMSYSQLKELDSYMLIQEQIKIILKCPQWKLEQLEREGKYIVIRDAGLTQLEPNTLTCVNLGILDRDLNEVPDWVKELKLYNK